MTNFLNIKLFLMPQERKRRAIERPTEANRRLRRYGAAFPANAVEQRRINARDFGEAILRDAELFECLPKHRSGVLNFENKFLRHKYPFRELVVIRNRHAESVAVIESENNSPLRVHSNRPMPAKRSRKLFKPIRRRNAQIKNIFRSIDGVQFLEREFLDISRKPAGFDSVENLFRLFAREAFYHGASFADNKNFVN